MNQIEKLKAGQDIRRAMSRTPAFYGSGTFGRNRLIGILLAESLLSGQDKKEK